MPLEPIIVDEPSWAWCDDRADESPEVDYMGGLTRMNEAYNAMCAACNE